MLGAIIGDTVGSTYEFNNVRKKDFKLFTDESKLTDDSIMTLAVAEIIQNKWYDDKDKIIDTLKRWGKAYPEVGYGGMFKKWLFDDNLREAYNSFGNGSAMRISSVGWYANSEEEVKKLARLVTEVTHNHEEGLKGAEVVAMCIYYARIGKSKEFIRSYVEQYYDINFDYNDLVEKYKFHATCQKSVPQAIYCFLISDNFEDCLRTTISIGGDCDTTSAMSCAIAEAYYKDIDKSLIESVFRLLPDKKDDCDPKKVLKDFFKHREENNVSKKRC